jgi:hypothetical protein
MNASVSKCQAGLLVAAAALSIISAGCRGNPVSPNCDGGDCRNDCPNGNCNNNCPNGNCNNGGVTLKQNLGLNMANVAGFVIAERGSVATRALSTDAADAGSGGPALYAVNNDGTMTIVTVTEGPDGGTSQQSQMIQPVAVFNTLKYVFLAYWGIYLPSTSGQGQGTPCGLVALRKSDSALYCIPVPQLDSGSISWLGPSAANLLQTDATGYIVWYGFNGLFRMDLTDPKNPTLSEPLGSSMGFGGNQAVNADGDDLIASVGGAQVFTRVMLAGGGFYNASAQGSTCLMAGMQANPNDFYFATNNSTGGGCDQNPFVKLTKTSATTFTNTTLGSVVQSFVSNARTCGLGIARTSNRLFMGNAAVCKTYPNPNPDGGVTVNKPTFVELSGDALIEHTVEAFATVTLITGCETTVFILGTDDLGNGGIVSYNVADSTFKTLLAPGAYALTKMDVSKTCEVTFYGQRAADGAYILGNIPAGSTQVTVIATGFPTVTQIQRID